VVVGRRDERDQPPCLEQVGVGVVLAVALAVVGQRERLAADVVAHVAARRLVDVGAVLVDVVADVDEERGVVLDDPPIGGEVAVLELRAADEAEAQLRRAAAERRRGARAADRARLAAGVEAVPVLAIARRDMRSVTRSASRIRVSTTDAALLPVGEPMVVAIR
jgi:hypothetical protein